MRRAGRAGGRMRPVAQYDLLLRAALGPLVHAGDALRTWRKHADIVDPDLRTLRLMPLLGERIAQLAPDDEELRRKVTHVSRFAWLRGQTMLKRTAPGIAALRAADIPVLLIKGAALIQIPGVEARLRLMDDLDVLVHPEHVPAATSALVAAGFRSGLTPTSSFDFRLLVDGLHALSFGDTGSEIDLHWHALHTKRHPDLDRRWWDSPTQAAILDVPVLSSTPADVLVQSIGHGAHWAQDAAPRWAVDIAMVLQATGDALDWDRVVDRARAARLCPLVVDALEYTVEATHVHVPASTLRELRAAPVPIAERLQARRRRDATDGGPVPAGAIGRLADAYESRVACAVAPGTRTGPLDAARVMAQEWSLPSAWAIPGHLAFLAAGRPWAARRLVRRLSGAPTRACEHLPEYRVGQVLSFALGGDGQSYLSGGWSCPEDFGTWSLGTPSRVVLPLAAPLEQDIDLELQYIGFVTPYFPRMRVDVAVNDVRVAKLEFDGSKGRPLESVRVRVPASVVRGWNRLEVVFLARSPTAPAVAREGSDHRRLAIALAALGTAHAGRSE